MVIVAAQPSSSASGLPFRDGDEGLNLTRSGVSRSMLLRDSTATLFAVLSMMDGVERWTLEAFGEREPEQAEIVRNALNRFSGIVEQFGGRIPASNDTFLQLMTWVHSSAAIYCIDFISRAQPDFVSDFMRHVESLSGDDMNARIALARFRVLHSTAVLDRIFSPENCQFVARAVLGIPA